MDIIRLKLSVTNDFLLKSKNGYILIDTGYDWEWSTFLNRLKDAHIRPSDISHLILTHHHDDHAGLLNSLVHENPSLRVVMSRHALEPLAAGKHVHPNGGSYINRRVNFLLSMKARFDTRWTHTFPPYTVRPSDLIVEGTTSLSQLGIGIPGKIVETPGHSMDSISLVLEDGNSFVGDAAAKFLQFAGTKYCVIFLENLEQYYASWKTLLDNGTKQVHPGHGGSFSSAKLQDNIYRNKTRNLIKIV